MKLKLHNHVRYQLSVGLWDMGVISASKKIARTIGAKNVPVYFKLTPLIVNDIGSSPAAYDCYLIDPLL